LPLFDGTPHFQIDWEYLGSNPNISPTFSEYGLWNEGVANIFHVRGFLPNNLADANIALVPEPISTVLFLVGGIPMAVSLYRKRNQV